MTWPHVPSLPPSNPPTPLQSSSHASPCNQSLLSIPPLFPAVSFNPIFQFPTPTPTIQSIHSFNSGFVPPPAAVQTLVGRVQGKVEGEPLLFEETLKVRAQAERSVPAAACRPHDQ